MRKMIRLLATLCLLLFLLPTTLLAQERTITGTILDDGSKAPMEGVTVRVKGTSRSAQTDAQGRFSIRLNPGETLELSYVGYETTTVRPGAGNTVAVSLKATEGALGEVVVTAMDIKRNARELGYSVQKLGGDEIKETQRENFLNSLQGRIAGATITATSGNAGASSSIVLRGFNSLSLSNQPLFVIDGVVVDNSTVDENSNGGSGVGLVERGAGLTSTNNQKSDYTNRISDINPNDIESITVLKGPEATALYGSQASSGAIIITTKKAKSTKLALQYDNSFRVQDVTRFPKTFDGFTNGTNGDSSEVWRYFGPAYGPGTKLYDNKESFFRTGFSQTHNLGADFGFKNSIFRVSGALFDQSGVIPFNDYKRYNIRISNTTKFGKYVEIMPAVSFIRTENKKVLRSAGGFMLGLLAWPGDDDITASQGDNATKQPLFAASATPNAEIDNPLFNVRANRSAEQTSRYNASLGININPFDWLTLSGRFGYETYNTEGYLRYHPLSYYIAAGLGGIQDNFWRSYNGYNHTITATARKTIAKDFNFRVMGGTMWQDYETRMFAISGTNVVDSIVNGKMWKNGSILTDAGYNALAGVSDSNATRPNTRIRLLRNAYGEDNLSIIRQIAYFGEFAFNYKNLAFISYTHRFEQASTLPKKNRNFNYPGASVSLIMSDIFPVLKKGVSYWKLRGSIASTARLNSPYSTQSVFVNHNASGGGYSYSFFNNNAELKPEKQKTFELGTELRFFKSRLTIDAAYYNTLNKGQIIENFRLSYGTGFVLNTQNAGSTRNKGFEFSLNAGLIKRQDFSWNMVFNFNKMRSKVVELPKNVSLYYIADGSVMNTSGGIASGIVLGGSTTTISGNGYARNNNGDMLINPTSGLPVVDANQKIRGDRNPDFTLGWNNTILYKNWSLSFLWDMKVGGDIYNGTYHYLTQIGKSPLTADRMTPRVLNGVLQDGLENTATPTRNTIAVIPYYNDNYYRLLPDEEFIEKDISWFRLRDITLRYMFPASFTKRLNVVKGLGVFVTATDVVLFTNYSGADPAVNANTAGTRGVGTFGFDYGTLPAQLAVNFGIRASF
ncbi:MAG: SusC/RagA family TonB-linked outer membrane protein [Chitinophagaceae bacterium]